jgi:hypothetical protein
MQSLMFTVLLAISQPALGFIADRSGLPAAYLGLASGLSILIVLLFWKSRHYFPQAAMSTERMLASPQLETSTLAQRQIARRADEETCTPVLYY